MSLIEDAIRRSKKLGIASRPSPGTNADGIERAQNSQAAQDQPRTDATSLARAGEAEMVRAIASLAPEGADQRLLRKQHRAIRQKLLGFVPDGHSASPNSGRLMMVASALPGEGKSTTTIQLAYSLSRDGSLPVVLVDADVTKRHLSRAAGCGDRIGILDYVARKEICVSEILYKTDVPGLLFVPAGLENLGLAENFEGPRVQALFSELRQLAAGAFVVADTGPLLLTSDAPLISTLVDQVILVAKAGSTPATAVQEAVTRIDQGVPACVILNQWQPLVQTDRYYMDAYYEYHAK